MPAIEALLATAAVAVVGLVFWHALGQLDKIEFGDDDEDPDGIAF